MPERLLERATACGARFDAVRQTGSDVVELTCDAASARELLALCKRFNLSARVTRRRGGSALARFARRRRTLPVGLALAIALCALFLGRIWIIDIAFSGENAHLGDPAALSRALREHGVRPGIARGMDGATLAQTLQADAGDYSYVGVHAQGVRLLVEAAPEAPAPLVYDVDAARDLVCQRDGVVVRAVAQSGELCVSPGDTVRRGQLLIRGEERSGQDETRPIAALGEVIVRCWFEGEAMLPLYETRTVPTGRASVGAKLWTPWFEVPILRGDTYPSQRVERKRLPIGGLYVPVEIERVLCRETRVVRVEADERELKQTLSALAMADASARLAREGPSDCEGIKTWINYERDGGALRAHAVLEIQANAAVTREALQGG